MKQQKQNQQLVPFTAPYKEARALYFMLSVGEEVTFTDEGMGRRIAEALYTVHNRYRHAKGFKTKKVPGGYCIWRTT